MEFNKKRILLVALISIVLLLTFMCLNFTTLYSVVRGEKIESFVKEGETEFDLENEAALRNKPDFSSKVIGTIGKGTHVQVLCELNKWVKITDGIKEGWVVKQNVVTIEVETPMEPEPPVETEPENNVVNNSISNEVTNETNTNSNTVINDVSNNTSDNNSSTSNVGKTGVVNVDTARVREEPDGKMVGLVDLNDKVEILAEEGDWYKVNVDEYKNCYIAKRLVTIK